MLRIKPRLGLKKTWTSQTLEAAERIIDFDFASANFSEGLLGLRRKSQLNAKFQYTTTPLAALFSIVVVAKSHGF